MLEFVTLKKWNKFGVLNAEMLDVQLRLDDLIPLMSLHWGGCVWTPEFGLLAFLSSLLKQAIRMILWLILMVSHLEI